MNHETIAILIGDCICCDQVTFDRGKGGPLSGPCQVFGRALFQKSGINLQTENTGQAPALPGPITSYHARIFWDSIVLPIEFPELVSISINLLMLSSHIWSIHIIHYRVPTLNITLDTIAYSHIKLLITYYLTSEFGSIPMVLFTVCARVVWQL